ncbi:MAG: MopE-related protein [Desulfobacterales bacterium]
MASRNSVVNSRHSLRLLFSFVITACCLLLSGYGYSAELIVAWDPNSEADLIGYRIYCGESSGHYTVNHDITGTDPDVPPSTTCKFTGLEEGRKYYFAAIAYSENGQSGYSPEISYTVPAAAVDPDDIDDDGDGYTENQGDCNDTDPAVHPGGAEICGDGIDQDCSGGDSACPADHTLVREAQSGLLQGLFRIVSDAAAGGGQYVAVANGEGTRLDGPDEAQKVTYTFNLAEAGKYRIKGAVYAANGGDDSFWVKVNGSPANGYLWDVLQNTGFQQDYVNDRNGADPVEVILPAGVNTVAVYLREDGTRLERIELELVVTTPEEVDGDDDGYTVGDGDCNDADAAVHPGAAEICGDGVDQDCSGADLTCPQDIDNDNDGLTENQGDCNDTDAAVHPGAAEICGDGIDQDCNGSDMTCVDMTSDSDYDGLTDFEEVNQYGTDPNKADTDGDGFSDGEEVAGGYDPADRNSKPDPVTTDLVMEFGEIQADHQWQTVRLNRTFTAPVVIVNAISYTDKDPAVTRVRNVTGSGFEMRIQEWDYLDGRHSIERVNYIVIESGSYELTGGTRLEAGRFNADAVASFASIKFGRDFNAAPVVMATIDSVNEDDAVTMRLKNITTTGFDYRLQEQESNERRHAAESAGYIAWEPSAGSMNGFVFEIGKTPNSVTHAFQVLPFYEAFGRPPVVLAGMQTTDGSDTAAERYQNKSTGGIEVKVEEEQSRDAETNHTTEVIGYMAFESETQDQEDDVLVNGLVREAEDGVLSGAFEIGSDAAASGGAYVQVPNGKGTCMYWPDERHKITYAFDIPAAGNYRIKCAAHAANGNDDSFWVKVNGSPAGGYLWDVLQNTGYLEDYVNDRYGADPVEMWLPAGTNSIAIYLRENGTRLDKIELEPVAAAP